MPEENKNFFDEVELKDIVRFINEIYGEDEEKSAALAAKFNDYLTGRYANINMSKRTGVSSIGPDGQFRKH